MLGLETAALKEGEDVIEPLAERIVGNVAAEDVFDPMERDEAGRPRMLVEAGTLIDEETAKTIEEAGIETVKIRSVLTCESQAWSLPHVLRPQPGHHADGRPRRGGRHHRRAVHRRAGYAADAAHVPHRWHGGAYRRADDQALSTKVTGVVEFGDRLVLRHQQDGESIVTSYEGELIIKGRPKAAMARRALLVPLGATMLVVNDGRLVREEGRHDPRCSRWDPYTNPIIADVEGTIRFVDLVEDESMSEELDELTGLRQRVVIEDREKKLHPHIEIWQTKGGKEKRVRDFVLPVGAQLTSTDGQDDHAPVRSSPRSAAKRTRRATSPAVCRVWPSCSKRVARRIRRRSPRSTVSCGSATSSAASARSFVHPADHRRTAVGGRTRRRKQQLYEVPSGKHLARARG